MDVGQWSIGRGLNRSTHGCRCNNKKPVLWGDTIQKKVVRKKRSAIWKEAHLGTSSDTVEAVLRDTPVGSICLRRPDDWIMTNDTRFFRRGR